MLQLGGTNRRAVTRPMANFQAASRVRHGKEGVVKQKSCKDKTDPPVPSEIAVAGQEVAKDALSALLREEQGPEPGVQPVPEVGRYVKMTWSVLPPGVTSE